MSELFAALTDGSGHSQRWPARLKVCSQTEARRHGAAWAPTHIISIYGPTSRYLGLADFDQARQLHLRFEDTASPTDEGAPTLAHVEAVIAFVDALPADAQLLIHCLEGSTRAAAMALGILARAMPADKAGQTLFQAFANVAPSPLVIALWDKALGLEGKLSKAGRKFPTTSLRRAVA